MKVNRTMPGMDKYVRYFDHLEDHIRNVETCYELLTGHKLNRTHDESKYDESEFYGYAWYHYPETRPEGITEEEVNYKYNLAWSHHQKNNPHHWQYYVVISDNGNTVPVKMDEDSMLELVADWSSFGIEKKNPYSAQEWYDENKDGIIMHPETRDKVERLINLMTIELINYLRENKE